MTKEEGNKTSLSESDDASLFSPSPEFMNWARHLQIDKLDYLNLLITVQQLLLKDIREQEYKDEDLQKLEENLLVLRNVILNA